MSYPGILQAQPPHTQQYYAPQQQQQQQQPIPQNLEAIEMRPTAGFTRLPQDPPMQPRLNQMETTMSNGMVMYPTPNYHPPTYTRQNSGGQRSQLPFSHHNHNYEELPFPRPTESSTDDVTLEEKQELPRQESHTEVDQYFNPPVHSISSTPLTITEPAEKKPRKKVNPIYDRYQGPTEKITKTKEGSEKISRPSKGHCRSVPGRCLRHPITIAFIFILVAVVIIAVVLIWLGKIETPASLGSQDKQVQPTSKVTAPPITTPSTHGFIPEELLGMIEDQKQMIDELKTRIDTLETMLGGDGEVNASLSTKVNRNMIQIDTIDNSVSSLNARVSTFESSLSTTIGSLQNTKTRTAALENSTAMLDQRVGALNAKAVTQSQDILRNKNENDAQTNRINELQQGLSVLEQKASRDLAEVNRTIYSELDTISKMQGPRGFNGTDGALGERGPPGQEGAGNLSLCEYIQNVDNAGYSFDYTRGRWIVTLSDKIITGFSCSTSDGTLATLDSQKYNGVDRYRCICSGGAAPPTDSSDQRTCFTHYWQCPRTS